MKSFLAFPTAGFFLFISAFVHASDFHSVCDRTPKVREHLVSVLKKPCEAVTSEDLLTIKILRLYLLDIDVLDSRDFEGLSAVEDLFLPKNKRLSSLLEGLFTGMTALRALYLQGNQFESLSNGIFRGLISLKKLYLQENKLEQIPADIFKGLVSLEEINLKAYQLTA